MEQPSPDSQDHTFTRLDLETPAPAANPELSLEAEQERNRHHFADLYQQARVTEDPTEQLRLVRQFESELLQVVDPGSSSNLPDEGIRERILDGEEPLWIAAGTQGQRIFFENHRYIDDTEVETTDGKPGWMRYTQPSSHGLPNWERYIQHFGAGDKGYVQLVPNDRTHQTW